VDLAARAMVQKVIIWNRADCCRGRLNNVYVNVDNHRCGQIRGARSVNTINCNKVGRYVSVRKTNRDYLTLCEVRVYGRKVGALPPKPWKAKVGPVKLVSQRRPAKQSSEGWSGRPSRAVDGNTNQRYGHKSCTHTQRSGRPWWRVDLQKAYQVQKVMIWNRVDCCANRLKNVDVFLDRQRCGRIGHPKRINTITCGFKTGRFVWVKQTRSDYLTLCEVRVYARGGPAAPVQKGVHLLSQRKKASQSSEGWSGRPSRAVDGNTNQRYGHKSCTHTQRSGRPWWKVNLGKPYRVQKVQIWNRSDCCQNRLRNVEVFVDNKKCGKLGTTHSVNTINCNYKKGKIIMVRQTKSDYLTLCEVRVYGMKPGN